jgi:hypothetical protein
LLAGGKIDALSLLTHRLPGTQNPGAGSEAPFTGLNRQQKAVRGETKGTTARLKRF